MRAAILCALALASSVACRENLPIELDAVDFDYGFFVTYPEEGPPIRVTPTFGVADGRIAFGETPSLLLEESEQRFVFVALSADQLPASFERARAAQIDSLLEPPPAGLLVEGFGIIDLFAKTEMPRNAQLLTSDLENGGGVLRAVEEAEFDLFDEVTLRIPVEPEHCRIPGQTMAPFGSRATPLPAPAPIIGVEYLDDDRVIAASRRYLYLLERNTTFTSTLSGPIWSTWQDPQRDANDAMADFAVGPLEADGSRSIVVVGGDVLQEVARFGRIWLLRLQAGVFTLESSQTIPGQRILAATFTPDGAAWIGGPDGMLLMRAPGATEFVAQPPFEYRSDTLDGVHELIPISTTTHDMMASLANHLYLRELDGTWEYQYVQHGGILGPEAFRFAGLTAVEDESGRDYWAVGDRGNIARKRDDEDWLLLSETDRELLYPPRFLPCASPSAPGEPLLFNGPITAAVAFEGYVHLGYENCNALVVVRRSDQCVSLVPPPETEVAFDEAYVVKLDRRDRKLLIGTTGGAVYESVLP